MECEEHACDWHGRGNQHLRLGHVVLKVELRLLKFDGHQGLLLQLELLEVTFSGQLRLGSSSLPSTRLTVLILLEDFARLSACILLFLIGRLRLNVVTALELRKIKALHEVMVDELEDLLRVQEAHTPYVD